MKILIADDEEIVRKSLRRAFAQRGHEVIEATNGAQALTAWRNHNPDIAILDIIMPELNGYQVVEARGESSTKVVLMSAYWNQDKKIKCDLFLEKPFEDIFKTVDIVEGLVP